MIGYQYVVLRVVPRVDREEFVNVGVVLYAQSADLLQVRTHIDPARLRALAPGVDIGSVRESLAAIEAVCRGDHGPRAAAPGLAWQTLRLGQRAALDGRAAWSGARRALRGPGVDA